MTAAELQMAFLNQIRDNLPQHLSVVDAIAENLHLSNDSAYRRLRGEKLLTFDEIEVLSRTFNVSLDSFLQLNSDAVVFKGRYLNREKFDFETYLSGIKNQLDYFISFRQKHLYYLNKDIPIFHLLMFPELATFKCYFWSRYNLDYARFNREKFSIEDFIDIFNNTGSKISQLYLQIPSTEIWNVDCINTTLRQIEYYRDTRIFKSSADVETVYNCLEKLVNYIEKLVETGYKAPYGMQPANEDVKYNVYLNDFFLGDNSVIAELDGKRIAFVNHNVIQYLMTTNEEFIKYTFDTLKVLLKKSRLISEISERDRQEFFDTLRERIHESRKPDRNF